MAFLKQELVQVYLVQYHIRASLTASLTFSITTYMDALPSVIILADVENPPSTSALLWMSRCRLSYFIEVSDKIYYFFLHD